MNAVLYLRVSTEAQAVDGYGLAAQEGACRTYAQRNGIRIVQVFRDEGEQGSLPAEDRRGLMAALSALQEPAVDVLLVPRLDRLARALHVQEALMIQVWKANRDLHSADVGEILRDDPDDPMRTFLRQVMGAVAQLDKGLIVKRMKDGRKAKAAKGGRAVGPAPYGYLAKEGGLWPIEEEQEALARMNELRAEGSTMAQIAATLAAEGYPTKRGGRWTSPVVSRILSRPPVPAIQIVDPTKDNRERTRAA